MIEIRYRGARTGSSLNLIFLKLDLDRGIAVTRALSAVGGEASPKVEWERAGELRFGIGQTRN